MVARDGLGSKLAQVRTAFLQLLAKEDPAMLVSLLMFSAGMIFLCACIDPSEDCFPPLLQMEKNLIFAGGVAGVWVISAGLGWWAVRRARKASDSRGLRKCRVVFLVHSLFSALAIIGLSIGSFLYFEFERIDRIRAEEEAASARAKFGDGAAYDRQMAKNITLDFQGQLEEIKKKYQLAGASLREPPILDMAGVANAEEVASRSEVLIEFMAAARVLRNFCKSSMTIYRYEVGRRILSSETRRDILKDFEQRTGKLNPTIIAMRDAELRKCEAMLKVLGHLEKTWGRWNWDSAESSIAFEDNSQAKIYHSLAAKVERAETEMIGFQKQLALLQGTAE